DRISRLIERLARLDLDKNDGVAPPRHDIDFAKGRAEAPRENAVTLGDQKSGGPRLGGKPGAKRFHARGRSLFSRGDWSGSAPDQSFLCLLPASFASSSARA